MVRVTISFSVTVAVRSYLLQGSRCPSEGPLPNPDPNPNPNPNPYFRVLAALKKGHSEVNWDVVKAGNLRRVRVKAGDLGRELALGD